jgi:hypothetical protein
VSKKKNTPLITTTAAAFRLLSVGVEMTKQQAAGLAILAFNVLAVIVAALLTGGLNGS